LVFDRPDCIAFLAGLKMRAVMDGPGLLFVFSFDFDASR
jgi:hypothetical protein